MTCPGGSYAILLAMVTARNTRFPESKRAGVRGLPELVVLTSAEAHYSISKNAMLMGLGLDHVIKVATTAAGQMRPDALRTQASLAFRGPQGPFAEAAACLRGVGSRRLARRGVAGSATARSMPLLCQRHGGHDGQGGI